MLPHTIQVRAVQLPGRDVRVREPAFTAFDPLVERLAAGLEPWLDERPFALFGHSMGALLSFALARARRRAGKAGPVMLIVSGHNAPGWPSTFPCVASMSDADVLHWLRRLGGTPGGVFEVPELLEMVLRTLRADLMVCDSYAHTPEAPLACPIVAFGGLEDPYTSRDGLLAWKHETSAKFSARLMPGSHFFLHSGAQELLAILARELLTRGRSLP
jgi:medium-chain acyl-[acyl-carrier-protein] hydrolase